MADVHSNETRSRNMAAIRSGHTKPEMLVRSGLHARGFRFRLHDKKLPGRPDLVLPRYRAIIQVQGCYWHGHECAVGHSPASRLEYWQPKISRNKLRDADSLSKLNQLHWRVLIIWECALRGRRRRPFDDLMEDVATWIAGGLTNWELAGTGDEA